MCSILAILNVGSLDWKEEEEQANEGLAPGGGNEPVITFHFACLTRSLPPKIAMTLLRDESEGLGSPPH